MTGAERREGLIDRARHFWNDTRMASVLAIVSKALFEKMVPGKEELGVVIETDQYVSANKAFDQLGSGDAIFLVTVRPPKEDLWLVGILEAPEKNGKAWKSAANTVPITDITKVLKKLELASGEGIKAKKGTLGMSLQTPRVLAENDDSAIRELVKGWDPSAKKVKATQDYADAVAAGPKKKNKGEDDDLDDDEDIFDEGAPSKKPTASKWAQKPSRIILGTLTLENYRKPFAGTLDQLTEVQRGQLQALIDSDMDSDGMKVEEFFSDELSEEDHPMKALEWIDVVEIATNRVIGDLLIFPFGDGVVLKHGTETLFANIVQHGIEPTKDTTKAWMTDFAKAWWEGASRLKVDDVGHFGFRHDQIADADDQTSKPAKSQGKGAALAKATTKAPTTKPAPKKAPAKKPATKVVKRPTKKPTKKLVNKAVKKSAKKRR
jgi:hypothetical protein